MPKPKHPAEPRDYYIYNPEVTLEEVAKAYHGTKGCSLDNLKKRSRKENWPELRHQQTTKTALKTSEKIAEKTAELVSDLVLKNPLLGKDRLLQELCNIAYFNIADICNVDTGGAIECKPFDSVPESAKRALKKLREKRRILSAGEGPGDNIVLDSSIEAEPFDKLKAIDMICNLMQYNKAEPPKPPEESGTPEEISGYLDIWNWTEEEKVIYMATGQKPAPKSEAESG